MHTVHPTLLIGPSDWQPQRMPKEEFLRRISALWEQCPGASHALVYGNARHHAELAYFTNLAPKLEATVALLARAGEHKLFVGGGANMFGAARPLTWIAELAPLRELEHLSVGDCVLIGGGYMAVTARENVTKTIGEAAPDATAPVWSLMRRKSAAELAAIRAACDTLGAATMAMAHAKRVGLGLTDVVLAGEKIANERGAQDVRTLFSRNGGRTFGPFTGLIRDTIDPLAVYIAVRQFNYWAEGFAHLTHSPSPVAIKAAALLHNALGAVKAGANADEIAQSLATEPYSQHPMTQGALANAIGLALEEPPHTDVGETFEAGEVYSLKVGLTDGDDAHAITSAMIAVREDGNEVLWPVRAAGEGTEAPP